MRSFASHLRQGFGGQSAQDDLASGVSGVCRLPDAACRMQPEFHRVTGSFLLYIVLLSKFAHLIE